jgi:hypothetical protein
MIEGVPSADDSVREGSEQRRPPLSKVFFDPFERQSLNFAIQECSANSVFNNPEFVLDEFRRKEKEGVRANYQTEGYFDLQLLESALAKIKTWRDAQPGIDETNHFSFKFRYVLAPDKKTLHTVLTTAGYNGGKRPGDELVGVCLDNSGKVDDYLRMYGDEELILFVYDSKKLQNLTPEERATNSKFAAGYGYKPAPGLELRDALLGAFVFAGKYVPKGK